MKKIILLGLLMFATIAANAQNRPTAAVREARKSIEASNAIYSDLANKNDDSILSRYTDDACLLPPSAAPVCGRKQIGKFFANGPKVHSVFTIQNLYGDAREYVTEESYYQMTDLAGNRLDEGKVLVVWKKTPAGWKMHRDMFSSNHLPKN